MKVLLLDIWQDLRQKRLWPVALGLLAAVVVVPVAMIASSGGDAPPPAKGGDATADASSAPEPGVTRASSRLGGSSTLDSFKPHDPFVPGKGSKFGGLGGGQEGSDATPGAPSAADGGGAPAPGGGAEAAGTPGTSSASSDGGSAGSSGSPGGGSAAGGSGGSGGSTPGGAGGAGGSGGGGQGGTGGTGDATPVRFFTQEADVRYGRAGNVRSINGLRPLDLLTNSNPMFMLSGLSLDGEQALFTVLGSDLEDEGDGRCVDVGGRCALLYLRPGEEHRFAELDGDVFRLKLIEIRRVELKGDLLDELTGGGELLDGLSLGALSVDE